MPPPLKVQGVPRACPWMRAPKRVVSQAVWPSSYFTQNCPWMVSEMPDAGSWLGWLEHVWMCVDEGICVRACCTVGRGRTRACSQSTMVPLYQRLSPFHQTCGAGPSATPFALRGECKRLGLANDAVFELDTSER
jgi:hypothetical protein